ncbi:DNA-directed RNA polymerase subunit alpha [Candidatus Daviesbacteria bacterium RIFCSPLOWO2_01_FULL_43_38]|uniref:DNA-directed RNA polymerase subunit alpha n=2 Tax=Candidatus Daviesiibacteriota TaxID=1752718 RepID=A0A1F5K7U0_9BACT|nr:MAG: DNA-directed RNA polymerase subunit alpha [Candidatus Daviesbacteria bacterium GW2011_GWA2_42_7]OGE20396.1 MAG: DNA-directed RNA polymerase subunit alpha [Candidatus Daviesbacteria bacterium RIFCSPHIGHO2_01_FULL_43_17]OGE37002.1 MAG: DNA-directed RNA polymerase subunit alpha [Candidatus Daviesbacteria bacterium RIFCSPHIGHO2_12_FULL_43_11]OGE63930.1 MAG: DNA-directed RNA polymerase subunit alpha [Candidatus Daviesbacteria bacterium RIFCSPLOWO2_01_FULL_43_38]OGE69009.1 MAG: DNA-directed R
MINFKVVAAEQSDTIGTFVIEPLESGFGHTIGNCLRRILLSSLEGAAITSVKIDGVTHQFSTITGVSEDVTEIILNLKKVRMKLLSDKPIKLRLQASGKGEVKASDIDALGGAEIINPDLHIASLNSPSAKLNIEMTAEKGSGYVMAEEKKTAELGVIVIDSIYSPVLSINYKVEPARVGRSTNFNKLTLQITTDGTISPEDALNAAAKILNDYSRQIYEPVFDGEEVAAPTVSDDILNLSVEELDLPVRITNALKAVDIDTVEKLTTVPRNQLLKAKNLGVQSLTLISQKLSERGLTLSEA